MARLYVNVNAQRSRGFVRAETQRRGGTSHRASFPGEAGTFLAPHRVRNRARWATPPLHLCASASPREPSKRRPSIFLAIMGMRGGKAAVDDQSVAIHIRGIVRGQEQRGISDLDR